MKRLKIIVALALTSGCYDACYSLNVSGKVTRLGKRMHSTGESVEERVAVTLNPFAAEFTSSPTIEHIAGGFDGLSIDCVSTRCASLEDGQCVEFSCRRDWRFGEPDVVECKMVRTTSCPEKRE